MVDMDTGLNALIALAKFHQLPVEADQLAGKFSQSGEYFSDSNILSAAEALALKAKHLKPTTLELMAMILPAIAKAKDNSYFVLECLRREGLGSKESITGALIHDLRDQAPRSLTRQELDRLWSGELIAITPCQR